MPATPAGRSRSVHCGFVVHYVQHLHEGSSQYGTAARSSPNGSTLRLQQADVMLCCEGPAPEGFPPDLPAPEALTPADAKDAEPLMPLVSVLSCCQMMEAQQ